MQHSIKSTMILSDFVSKLSCSALPQAAIEKARFCLLDYLGSTIAGSRSREASIVRGYIQKIGGVPQASVIGMSGNKSSMPLAALSNGVACHVLEVDDAHRYATGLHPGATIIPAVLAVGEYLSAPADKLLTAIIAGYEVAGRVGRTINPSHRYRGFHSTGTVASLGAAAGAAKVMGLDTEKTAWAIGIGGSLAGGIFEFLSEGSMNKLLHAGHAAFNGVTAALLAEAEFTGPTSVLEGKEGFCRAFADKYDIRLLTDGLGAYFEIDYTYFKRHAACGHIFSAIDAVLELMPKISERMDQIKHIQIRSFKAAAVLNGQKPGTTRKAKFSIPFVIALVLLKGSAGHSDFTVENLQDPDVLNLAERIDVCEDQAINDAFPGKRTAIVEVEFSNGEKITASVDIPRGMPENPLSRDEIVEKFKSLTRDILGAEKSDIISENVLKLDGNGNIYPYLTN